MSPRYTDRHRWPHGYATAAQSSEAGYLKAKFAEIVKRQQEAAPVVTQIKPRVRGKA